MDEPNSSLSETESERLFSVIGSLKSRGVSVIYVSHKIDEVLRISDRITVLRDGVLVGTVDSAGATAGSVIKMMVGRELNREYVPHGDLGAAILCVKGLSGEGFHEVSFDLRNGEILCFAGLVGAGRSEAWRAIFGAQRRHGGEVTLEGRPVHFTAPYQAIAAGPCHGARGSEKALPLHGSAHMVQHGPGQPAGNEAGVRALTEALKDTVRSYVSSLAIKLGPPTSRCATSPAETSRRPCWRAGSPCRPRCSSLMSPRTASMSGAKSEVYELIRRLASSGIAIALISSELPEVIAMADRVVVMHEGRVTGILERAEVDEHRIMAHATGGATASEATAH